MSPIDLRTMRRRMNLTQQQLAGKLGVTRTTVSRWEMQSERYKIPPMVERMMALLADRS